MSAWIVNKAHIDVLVWALGERGLDASTSGDHSRLGRMLWAENMASIHGRYPDTEESHSDYPGPNGFGPHQVEAYAYATPRTTDWKPSELVSLVNCYQYQTCEHDGWESSDAHALMHDLEQTLRQEAELSADDSGTGPWGLAHCGGRHQDYEECTCVTLPDLSDVDATDQWLREETA